jgi:RNA-directed DNA polymerase
MRDFFRRLFRRPAASPPTSDAAPASAPPAPAATAPAGEIVAPVFHAGFMPSRIFPGMLDDELGDEFEEFTAEPSIPATAAIAEIPEDDDDEDDDEDDEDNADDDEDDFDEEEEDEDDEEDNERASRYSRQFTSSDDRMMFGEDLWGASQRHITAEIAADRLQRWGLPTLANEQDVANWLSIPLGRLRWYTHDRPADTVWHYTRRVVPKRSGNGARVILAPKRELKALQRKVLEELVARVPVALSVHGFVKGRSTVTNARQHVGKQIVLKLDLKDFFPSVTFPRVRGQFIALGYSFSVASTLALLCTEYDREEYVYDGTRYFVSIGPRHLVQGAPTSPALANLVAWRLDRRLGGLATKHGFTYTRYADDLTFSGNDVADVHLVRGVAQRIIRAENFAPNTTKTRLARQSARQMVTGIVVNETIAVPRRTRRRLRAIMHNAQATGLAAQNRDHRPGFEQYLEGMIAYIHAVNPQHAAALRAQLDALATAGG